MTMTPGRIRLLSLLISLVPTVCWGWGDTGHSVVAQIAYKHLDANARRSLHELLGDTKLADIASWADTIRKQPAYKWSDVQHCSRITPGFGTFVRSRDCPPEGCAVSAIDRFTTVLQDPAATKAQKIEAVKFLVHFVGDIHNPLHLTEKGKGVGTDVRITFFGESASLHKVWDESIIDLHHKSWEDYARELNRRITPEQIRQWSQLDAAVWATESYRLAKRVGYVIPADGVLGREYDDKCLPVVDERLSQAGVRLGLVLNYVFSHPSSQPASQPASRPSEHN